MDLGDREAIRWVLDRAVERRLLLERVREIAKSVVELQLRRGLGWRSRWILPSLVLVSEEDSPNGSAINLSLRRWGSGMVSPGFPSQFSGTGALAVVISSGVDVGQRKQVDIFLRRTR